MPFDFSQIGAPFRMQPGLRRLAAGAVQLTPARPGGRHQLEKIAVLSRYADQALVASPGFDAQPVLSTLAAEAAKDKAPGFVQAGDSCFVAPRLDWAVDGQEVRGGGDPAIGQVLLALPPAQRAAALLCLAFEEDFAVIDGEDTTIPWLAVCLPSRWAPEEKVGRRFAEVHAPVADGTLLVAASEQLTKLVTGGERWERKVWTLSADARLQQHPNRAPASWPTGADADAIGTLAFFRHEYQSFIPVPGTRQAAFTIRVDSQPLASSLLHREDAWRIHAALSSMSEAVLTYRGLDSVRDRLLAWLAVKASTLPTAA